jgi:hypothetical protein
VFYLPEQDLLFIHIPRTGGKSFKMFLENYGTNTDIEIFDNHSPVSTVCHYFDNPDSNHKLAMVRNPYDREVSLWRWGIEGPLAASDMSFEYWCNWRFRGKPKDVSNLLTYLDPVTVTSLWAMHKTPQVYYLVDESTAPRVDYIGCFERMEEMYDHTRKRFHENYDYVKHVAMGNPTPHRNELNKGLVPWQKIYEQCDNTDDVLDLIYDFYKWDFDTFGYPKDWQIEDTSPTRNTGIMPKPSSDPYAEMMDNWPLREYYGSRGIQLLHDSISYRYMPEGKNRGVFLQNTSKLKVNDVVLRENS